MKVKITYEEILTKEVEVEIKDDMPFDDFARKLYRDEKIVLTADDLQITSFMIETTEWSGDWSKI
ncbi:DpnD/PcfM family protein [Weissella cibaria]|uniref:DpnD/PcfM family protein n=1 Tax=Weissella cibaria TaxID=137591 RepID=UPI0031B5A26A